MSKLFSVALLALIFGCSTFETNRLNNVKVSRISFESSQCSNECNSFQLQIDSSKRILYNGLTGIKKGYYTGNIDGSFWKYLVDHIQQTDLKHLKKQYGQKVAGNQTLILTIETDKGTYQCSISGKSAAPSAVKDLIAYIFRHYRKIKMVPLNIENILKPDNSPQRKAVKELLNKVPC